MPQVWWGLKGAALVDNSKTYHVFNSKFYIKYQMFNIITFNISSLLSIIRKLSQTGLETSSFNKLKLERQSMEKCIIFTENYWRQQK